MLEVIRRPLGHVLLASAGLTAATLVTGRAQAQSSDVEEADLPESGTGGRTVLAGAAATAAFYGAALGASYLWSDGRWAPDVRIPVAGPWLALRHSDCPAGSLDCSKVTVVFRIVLLTLDALGQAGSLGVVGEGLFLKTDSEVEGAHRRLELVPLVAAGSGNLALGVGGAF